MPNIEQTNKKIKPDFVSFLMSLVDLNKNKNYCWHNDFPGGSYNAGDLGSMPGLGRSPGEENDNPLQNSCLKNPMDKWAW